MMASASSPLVSTRSLAYAWSKAHAGLRFDDFDVAPGERLFLCGPSGSGKSTLLGLLAGVLVPSSGEVGILGTSLASLGAGVRDRFRANHLGYIFQQFNLLPFLSPVENVLLGCAWSGARTLRAGRTRTAMMQEATRLLAALGLDPDVWSRRRTGDLSVGQQQRVAAARALIGGPELLLADEPTSALDAATRDTFLKLLLDECTRHGTGVVFVSHDLSIAWHFDRSVVLGHTPLGVLES